MNHALTPSSQMPCLLALLPHGEGIQIDADVVGAPGVQSFANRDIAEVQPKGDQCSEGLKDWDWACMKASQEESGNASTCAIGMHRHTCIPVVPRPESYHRD